MKKIFQLMFLFTMQQLVFAETTFRCPTVSEIHQNQLGYWLPLYIEGEELASTQDSLKFMSHVTSLQGARWSASYLESGHCFYQGDDSVVTKIVLAQDAWRPKQTAKWVWRAEKFAECYSQNPDDCEFIQ